MRLHWDVANPTANKSDNHRKWYNVIHGILDAVHIIKIITKKLKKLFQIFSEITLEIFFSSREFALLIHYKRTVIFFKKKLYNIEKNY